MTTARTPLSSQQGRRTGMGSPVPARGRSTGGRQQPSELVPVAPITEKAGAAQATVGAAPAPGRVSGRGHGYSGYTGGCRCAECREAKAAYMRNKRLDAAAARNQTPPTERYVATGITHGTISGYKDSSCRCTECSNAKYLQDRRLFVAQKGGISSGVALIVTMLGLAVFGFLNEVGRPNGLTLLALIILAGILWALAATARGYRVLDRRDIAYTEKQLKKTKNTTPAAATDQLVHLLADLLRMATGHREGAQR